QLVLFKPLLRTANSSDNAGFQILLASHKIEDFAFNWIEEQSIDREIAALNIFARISAELNAVGVASIAVTDVAAKRRNFNNISFRMIGGNGRGLDCRSKLPSVRRTRRYEHH